MRTKVLDPLQFKGRRQELLVTPDKATDNNGDVRAAQLGLSVFTCISIWIRGHASSMSLGGYISDL